MMNIQHVSKRLGEKLVLHDINLEIEDGIIYGLIGPNGAGKSTLLRIIAGIYKSELGSVTLDGEKVYENPKMKQDVVLISDEPFYSFHASLRDMKEFYKTFYPNLDEDLYASYVKQFHLDDTKSMNNFSKGMRRQGFIILGLAIAPRYLLLDEAFDGLDPMMRHQFKKEIVKRIEAKSMSVIISSHNLLEMQDLCDRFGMLEKGSLKTSGNVIDTLENVHKVQLAFAEVMKEEDFQDLDILALQLDSRIVNLVVRGDKEKIISYLETLHPLLIETLPVNLEEIFLYELTHKGRL